MSKDVPIPGEDDAVPTVESSTLGTASKSVVWEYSATQATGFFHNKIIAMEIQKNLFVSL